MKRFLLALCILCLGACSGMQYAQRPVGANRYSETMNDLAIYAVSLADTPYKYGGNSPGDGLDCSGFVDYVFRKVLGKDLPRTSREISRIGERVERDQLLPGDLVFFNTRDEPYSHVGIYVGADRFVHAPGSGKAISLVSMRNQYWQTRYDGARRVDSR